MGYVVAFDVCARCIHNVCFFFFFKQKTAYDMRISDWSSDVCSSDLAPLPRAVDAQHEEGQPARADPLQRGQPVRDLFEPGAEAPLEQQQIIACRVAGAQEAAIGHHQRRSEEHTSELQSLMRISYAVFCLKKKKDTHYTQI